MTGLLDLWAARGPARFRERGLLTLEQAMNIEGSLVYVLCDDTGESFYVGKTTKPAERFRAHGTAGGLNFKTRARYQALGARLRISIAAYNPPDLDEIERQEIARRPWCLNIVVPGHWRWNRDVENVDGMTFLNRGCVTDFILAKIKRAGSLDVQTKRAKRIRNAMCPSDRYEYELAMFGDMPAYWQVQKTPWVLQALRDLEALGIMSEERFRRAKMRVEVHCAAARWVVDDVFARARAMTEKSRGDHGRA